MYYNNNLIKKEGSEVVTGIKRKQYSRELKDGIAQKILSGKSILELGKENNIFPSPLNKWKGQYLEGVLSNHNN